MTSRLVRAVLRLMPARRAGRTAAVPPPGGLELAGADADGP
jgi:hypothetical protein